MIKCYQTKDHIYTAEEGALRVPPVVVVVVEEDDEVGISGIVESNPE